MSIKNLNNDIFSTILTGAGFSANFGLPLANELWNYIFNNRDLRENHSTFELIKKKKNFEEIYDNIGDVGNKKKFKQVLQQVLSNCSNNIDDQKYVINVQKNLLYSRDQCSSGRWIIDRKRDGQKYHFFTLNQDYVIEKYLPRADSDDHCIKLLYPGLKLVTQDSNDDVNPDLCDGGFKKTYDNQIAEESKSLNGLPNQLATQYFINYGLVRYGSLRESSINEYFNNPIHYVYFKDESKYKEEREFRISLCCILPRVVKNGKEFEFPDSIEMNFDFIRAINEGVITNVIFSEVCSNGGKDQLRS